MPTGKPFPIPVDIKLCSRCGETLPLTNFYYQKGRYISACKACIKKSVKNYRDANKVKIAAQKKAYDLQNKDKMRVRTRRYALKHPARIRAQKNKYEAHRKKIDPAFKLRKNMSQYMWQSLARVKISKRASWLKYVGYTIQELKCHLESQFTEGMSWDNYGQWHVDHKVPLAHFSIQSIEDPKLSEAWALSNLQPLWAMDNFRKGARYADK